MSKIVGLIGFKGSGKSTAFKIWENKYGVKEVMLADHLKNVCSEVFNIKRDHFDDQNYKEKTLDVPVLLTESSLIKIMELFDLKEKGADLSCPVIGGDYTLKDNIKPHIGVLLESPRRIAQYVGSEVLRSVDPDIHIKMAVKKMNNPDFDYVVTDIRFKNEFNYFKKNSENYMSVFIKRKSQIPEDLSTIHQSEKDVLKIGEKADIIILNDYSMDVFEQDILDIGKHLFR